MLHHQQYWKKLCRGAEMTKLLKCVYYDLSTNRRARCWWTDQPEDRKSLCRRLCPRSTLGAVWSSIVQWLDKMIVPASTNTQIQQYTDKYTNTKIKPLKLCKAATRYGDLSKRLQQPTLLHSPQCTFSCTEELKLTLFVFTKKTHSTELKSIGIAAASMCSSVYFPTVNTPLAFTTCL